MSYTLGACHVTYIYLGLPCIKYLNNNIRHPRHVDSPRPGPYRQTSTGGWEPENQLQTSLYRGVDLSHSSQQPYAVTTVNSCSTTAPCTAQSHHQRHMCATLQHVCHSPAKRIGTSHQVFCSQGASSRKGTIVRTGGASRLMLRPIGRGLVLWLRGCTVDPNSRAP